MMDKETYETDLLKKLETSFHNNVKPAKFYYVSDGFQQRYEQEFSVLETLDWENVSPEELSRVYEPNTFLSAEAYKFLIPRVVRYCLKYRNVVPCADLISVFFYLPILDERIGSFHGYLIEQRKLYWEAFSYINVTLEFDLLDEEESSELRLKLRLD